MFFAEWLMNMKSKFIFNKNVSKEIKDRMKVEECERRMEDVHQNG